MHVLYARCAGLDVHKKTVVACVMLTEPTGEMRKQVRTFATTTQGLLALADWLTEQQVTQVAMESTGIYWRPIFNILEAAFGVVLVNAQHMKAVPGRKTDVKDAEWLADLLRHGLLKASFIPPQPIRDLRDLVRYRKTLIQARSQEINRVQKVLETANIKLSSVVSDVMGASGRSMIQALITGEQSPEVLAELAQGSLHKKIPQLREALLGRVDAHHQILLSHLLAHISFLDQTIFQLFFQIQRSLAPFEEAVELLVSIPGVAAETAACILGEIGVDMACFPSAAHLASWAGVCPGNRESAGKRLSGQTTKGNKRLKAALAEVVWVVSHTKDNYLSAQYHRLARRLGKPKAVIAVSHSLLVIIYHMLRDKQPYRDLGADFFEAREKERVLKSALRRLEGLGYTVTLQSHQEVSA
ncbi:MAG TPA: IS110 family transposase [Ktedonobacteraceae bacterium]|nr:IS110 family transposase [Ktedonobacteraceae bacterium]